MKSFRFELGDQVAISVSGEKGQIKGRAEYQTAENAYLVRYVKADGCAVEAWWDETALQPVG